MQLRSEKRKRDKLSAIIMGRHDSESEEDRSASRMKVRRKRKLHRHLMREMRELVSDLSDGEDGLYSYYEEGEKTNGETLSAKNKKLRAEVKIRD